MKKIIYSLSIIISLLLINIIAFILLNDHNKFFEITVASKNGTYKINYWYDDIENHYYVFIPSFAQIENLEILSNKNIYINDTQYKKKLQNLELNKSYNFTFDDEKSEITFLQSKNVATMFIDTKSGNLFKIHKNKNNKEEAKMKLINKNGGIEYAGNLDYIKGRGNSTWKRDKKPYNIQLSKNTNLLNMGKSKHWALIANVIDKTHIRNKMIFEFAKSINLEYSPDSEYTDLYINGEYKGLYLLSENIEVGKNRVDIDNKHDITGPYLLEMDLEDRAKSEDNYFSTNRNNWFVIKNDSNLSEEKMNYIKNIWQEAEDAIFSHKNIDKYIDIESWAKKYLIEEVFGNFDANNTSTFFYKKSDNISNLIYAGPVWDYDGAVGELFKYNKPDEFIVNIKGSIWNELMKNKEFNKEVKKQYNEIFLPKLEKLLNSDINEMTSSITEPINLDYTRWKNYSPNTTDTKIYIEYKDYNQNLNHLKNFIRKRINFLNSQWKTK